MSIAFGLCSNTISCHEYIYQDIVGIVHVKKDCEIVLTVTEFDHYMLYYFFQTGKVAKLLCQDQFAILCAKGDSFCVYSKTKKDVPYHFTVSI